MPSQLPQPTDDRAEAFRNLAEHGYCIIANALERARLAELRERLIEQAAGEDAAGKSFHDGQVNQRLWMLVNKGKAFRDLVLHPLVTEFMSELLGPSYLLSSLTANIARPGSVPMGLHTDQLYVDFWTPKPVVANIAWMLDEFTDENGGTRLVPGSHLQAHRPYEQSETIAACGPAGGALIFDGRTVHGTGENRSADSQRHALLSYFCRPFMRQQENFFLGLAPALRTEERPEFLERVGYRIWGGLGRIESPGQSELVTLQQAPLGPLNADGTVLDERSRAPAFS
ncbi:MAG TPA: phytanoyl-CoA dioxygenase family protein [Phenylobacterium sp.]|nr:phytanoyl-CoA dioxygenase family protein [Phenylobacterium sp.]